MKACVLYGAKDLRIEERSPPEIPEHGVQVALRAAGICGSDLHYYARGPSGPFQLTEPLVLGHELAGEVVPVLASHRPAQVAVGAAVKDLEPGERVAINPPLSCRQCSSCREGRENLCRKMRYPKRASPLGHRYLGSASVVPHVQGGFQEYLVVTVERCLRMPKTMSFGEAAFVEPLAVALHGIRRAGSLLGRSVLITGCGPIGLLMMLAAKVAGARWVGITDILKEPLKLARQLGADEVINVGTGDGAVEALAEDKGRMDVAIEASGSVQALETCLRCVRPGGRLVQVGNLPLGKHSVSLNAVMAKELDYVGALRFDREFAWAGEYLARGLIDVKPLLTRRYPLGEAVEAFEFAGDRRHACKVQLTVP